MKKYILLLLLIPSLSFNLQSEKIDIVGKWTGEDKGDIGFMTFDSEGYAIVEFGGRKIGGKNFKMRDKSVKMTYNYNADKNPIEIDLIITDMNDKQIRKMYFIAEFKDNDTMKLAASMGSDTRPKEFTDENAITLHRVK